ncbi:HSP20-like chaperone [Tricholoma matsutake]|nr:HSP20-like chaperone [Tricholoma matsutake 945]
MSIARQFLNEFRPLFRMLEEPFSRSPAYLGGYPSRSVFDDPIINSPFLNRPAVDVTEESDKYVLEADLPGVKKENLEVRIGDAGRSVTIQGKFIDRRKQPQTVESSEVAKTEDSENQISTERLFVRDSSFTRTVWLPRPLDGNNVAAKLHDGVLTITVNKMEDKASVIVPVQ